MFIAKVAGYILQWTGEYRLLFLIAACAYLVNLLLIHLLNPRLAPMDIGP
jgi:ACS family hexuronate transporter-like MFS transporter